MKNRSTFLLTVFLMFPGWLQASAQPAPPRLVVVIIADQFPYDYLNRFGGSFGEGGFRRLIREGANFVNASYEHAITLTAPGHAVILSGAYGNRNGIVTNTWYDTSSHATAYCVEDTTVSAVGGTGKGRSPANLIGSTFGDELRIASGFAAKVISLSHKDRAAVLLGGKLANGTFWMSDSAFVTSTYYTSRLPAWVREFNASGLVNSYFGRRWEQSLPESAFGSCDVDDAPYENGGNGLGRVFPHPITGEDRNSITPSYYHALIESPFGDEILSAFAKAAVRGERLGLRGVTDLLCISFSSNDYVGHAYGPHSREVAEITVKTDSVIADLLRFLDREVGTGRYIVALTSDHGIAPIPEYLMRMREGAEAGRVRPDSISVTCEQALTARFGPLPKGVGWLEQRIDKNLYLSRQALRRRRVSPEKAARVAADALLRLRGIAAVYTREQLEQGVGCTLLDRKARHSYHPLRSGDLMYVLKPYYIEGSGHMGSTHGDPYDYCAHVPLIIMGGPVKPGTYAAQATPADLAPTLSVITGVEFPAGREGRVLSEALR
ncbi:MAG: alkaline phosphatase family protein [Bacteroidota bacterium]